MFLFLLALISLFTNTSLDLAIDNVEDRTVFLKSATFLEINLLLP